MNDFRLATILHRLRRTAAAMAGIGDAELLQRFVKSRDEASFELLMWRHARLVWKVCRRVLQNDQDAEDAFQVTFLALARQAGRIKNQGSLAGWLYQVAYRAALTARAQRGRRRELRLEAAELAVNAAENSPFSNDDRSALDQEISRLPERFQIPVVLCYLEGKTVSETALLLGLPIGTVASRLARARARLRVRLARRGFELPTELPEATPNRSTLSAIPVAIPVLARKVLAGAVSETVLAPHVASLTKEVVNAMFLSKLKSQAILAVTVLGLILAGGGWAIHLYAIGPEGPKRIDVDEPQTKKADDLPKPKHPPQPERKAVTAVRPIRRDAAPYAEFKGRLVALQQVDIQPTVGGRLESGRFQPGADVKKGDLLFVIDPKSYELAVLKAEAELSRLKVEVVEKTKAVDYAKKLEQKGYTNKGEMEKILAQAAAAEAALRPAQVEVEQAKLKLEATKIVAPLDGRISEARVDPGNQVYAGSDKATVLATITVLDPIGMNFDMDERSYLRYQHLLREKEVKGIGGPLSMGVSNDEGFPREGALAGFGDRVDPETGTIRVRAKFANPDGLLLPGMYARVHVTFGRPRLVFEVPRQAIFSGNAGKLFVVVVNDQSQVEFREVHTESIFVNPKGHEQQEFIKEGLSAEDWVITSIIDSLQGLHSLQRGEEVKVERVKDGDGSGAPKQ
jgi:multidrug efflux system membrane fusion protein